MQNKHPNITYAYHFMSEAIIVLMFFLPIMYVHFQFVLYWNYLGVTVISCLLFSIYSKFTTKFATYILTTPILMFLFYIVGFPIELSVILPALLTWRYLNIRSKQIINRETTYLKIVLLLTPIYIILLKDIEILILALLLFLILMIGHLYSHLIVISKDNRESFNHKLWIYIVGIFMVGAMSLVLIFDTGRLLIGKLWEGVSYLIVFVASQAARMMDLINYSSIIYEEDNQLVEGVVEDSPENIIPDSHSLLIFDNIGVIYWAVAIIVLGVIIYLVIRSFKRTVQPLDDPSINQQVSYSHLNGKPTPKQSFINHIFEGLFRKPDHPVRKIVYQFERKIAGSKYERKSFETVEDWFGRMKIDTNIAVYQKVRYGELDVSKREVEELKKELKEIEARLKE